LLSRKRHGFVVRATVKDGQPMVQIVNQRNDTWVGGARRAVEILGNQALGEKALEAVAIID
jgi:hypothetical protein